jgi:hypothetical protein
MSTKPRVAAEAVDRTEEYIRRIVAEAPPLTDDQRSRIAALLRSDGSA